ncbi:MAG: chemotaxis protein CheW [Desulfuromonas sp.]|nr:MAG: chemotaxis protein CheW [Desulfuromonas sp.]
MQATQQAIESWQYLTFRLGQESFGIDVLKVREILDFVDVTKVPQSPDYMLGVINLRGSVVPVVDLRKRFAIESGERSKDNCIIVLEIKLNGEQLNVGIIGDMVEEVIDLRSEQIEPPPKLGSQLRAEFIVGMGKQDERLIILLDIDKIFSDEELSLVQAAGE